VWSLGLVVFSLLSCETSPWAGQWGGGGDFGVWFSEHVLRRSARPLLERLPPVFQEGGAEVELSMLLETCWLRNPQERPPAAAVAAALVAMAERVSECPLPPAAPAPLRFVSVGAAASERIHAHGAAAAPVASAPAFAAPPAVVLAPQRPPAVLYDFGEQPGKAAAYPYGGGAVGGGGGGGVGKLVISVKHMGQEISGGFFNSGQPFDLVLAHGETARAVKDKLFALDKRLVVERQALVLNGRPVKDGEVVNSGSELVLVMQAPAEGGGGGGRMGGGGGVLSDLSRLFGGGGTAPPRAPAATPRAFNSYTIPAAGGGGGMTLEEASLFTEMRPVSDARAAVEEAPSLDLAFVMDCSGSMSSYIEVCKSKVMDLVGGVKKQFPTASVRVAFVGYRDYCKFRRMPNAENSN
jgi:hypothetical protein